MTFSRQMGIVWAAVLVMVAIVVIVISINSQPTKEVTGEVKEAGAFVQGSEQDYCQLHEGYWNNETNKCQISQANTTELVIKEKKPLTNFIDYLKRPFTR
ncbi:MAG: hypothetical protein KJ574_00510 [Nanoarchaeota archaeon]|nr:hypothetical protein [Nanoarchaeota archaeon]